jgi:glycine/D-amino acid oxidase-like deaminating enzyme
MRVFDFVVIGGGIAGLLSAYFLRDFDTLLIDEDDILEGGASRAAGAFLFPKVGFDTAYTRFINQGILEAIKFYEEKGINVYKKGVLILPRDDRDIEKFKKYKEHIKIPFEEKDGGFFFKEGAVVEPLDVKKKIKVAFEKLKVNKIEKKEYFEIEGIKAKNIILATGYKKILDIPYIKIHPIWGERIEIKTDLDISFHYHKNCSLAKIDGFVKIGATHKRNCFDCLENKEEAEFLIQKANEIKEIKEYEITKIVGGFRAASNDYFPVVGPVIDEKETLRLNPKIVKGVLPKEVVYKEGLYIVNGMGGRGFSNALMSARALRDYIVDKKSLGYIDTKRSFIKWARKLESN